MARAYSVSRSERLPNITVAVASIIVLVISAIVLPPDWGFAFYTLYIPAVLSCAIIALFIRRHYDISKSQLSLKFSPFSRTLVIDMAQITDVTLHVARMPWAMIVPSHSVMIKYAAQGKKRVLVWIIDDNEIERLFLSLKDNLPRLSFDRELAKLHKGQERKMGQR